MHLFWLTCLCMKSWLKPQLTTVFPSREWSRILLNRAQSSLNLAVDIMDDIVDRVVNAVLS